MSKRPTPSQLMAMRNLASGKAAGAHIRGRSQSGGFSGTLVSLRRNGWIDANGLTESGRAVFSLAAARAALEQKP